MNPKILFGLIAILGIAFILNPVHAERLDAVAEWIMNEDSSTFTGGIRVVHDNANTDPNSIESLVVDVSVTTIVVGTYPFDDEHIQVTLSETGTDTGIFEGMVFITETDESSGNTIHVADNKDRIEFEYTYSQVFDSDSTEELLGTGGSILIEKLKYKQDVESKTTYGKIKWLETNYSSASTAVLQVVSTDMDLNPKTVDSFDVDVWSDTDFAGIDLTVTETGDATGIFEGTVFFTMTDDTSGHRLRVSDVDTIYSKFDGNTLHESLDVDTNDFISTASIHGAGIPIDNRVSLDKKSYAWNDKVIITINAPEENFDSNSIETIDSSKDSIKMYTRHFDIDNYNLVETGINSGIFSGEITLVGEFDNIDSDGITASFEYEEDITAIGSAPIVLNSESKSIFDDRCGVDTVSVDGVCQVVKVEKTKTVSDDAPFFGIFVYLDELFSWIFGNISMSVLKDKSKSSLGADEINALDDDKFRWTLNATKEKNRLDVLSCEQLRSQIDGNLHMIHAKENKKFVKDRLQICNGIDDPKKTSEFDDAPLIITNEPANPNEVIKSITLDNVPYDELVENEQEYVGNMLHYYGKISDVDRNTFTVSTAKIAVTPAAGWVDLIELTYNKFELTDDSFKEVWGTYRGVNEDTGLPMLQVFLIE